MNWPASAFRRASAFFLSASLLLTACEDPNELGLDLPGTTPISTEFKDFSVTASTVKLDSLGTLGRNQYLVGRLQDANLGTITARTFFETKVSTDSLPSQFTNARLDSVVLRLGFEKVYGTDTKPVRFDLFRLAQPLEERVTYTSASSPAVDQTALFTNVSERFNRTVTVRQRVNSATEDTTTVRVTIPSRLARLPLVKAGQSTAFTTQLFEALNTPGFNQTTLSTLLPGLALAPTAGYSGSIVQLGRSGSTRLVVYFHVDKRKTPARTYSIDLGDPNASGANPNAPRFFTQISTDLTGAGALAGLRTSQDSVSADKTDGLTYIQEGTGLSTKLFIPGLNELRKQPNLIINRAELIIPVKPFANLQFPNPSYAFLYEVNRNNQVLTRNINGVMQDRLVQGDISSAQGAGNAAVVTYYDLGPTNKYYSVLLTSYVQAYVAGKLDTEIPEGFLLTPSPRSINNLISDATVTPLLSNLTLNRAVLDANNIRLRVYTSSL
ncbi:hypothetical protein PK28_02070 [Hymenobacter sp. DG25B]|uniref:DUF4270 family protein n=1 Tax=Hymenobacter sp. DG25B TaxID=1385664 RepID=UPI000540E27B|nr:DUF4270 family protein [Hymenobacter sp. DG25B]AIZ62769.1 hypothetical protein PK28_02070 [Hymenobacter sp. DG25B]